MHATKSLYCDSGYPSIADWVQTGVQSELSPPPLSDRVNDLPPRNESKRSFRFTFQLFPCQLLCNSEFLGGHNTRLWITLFLHTVLQCSGKAAFFAGNDVSQFRVDHGIPSFSEGTSGIGCDQMLLDSSDMCAKHIENRALWEITQLRPILKKKKMLCETIILYPSKVAEIDTPNQRRRRRSEPGRRELCSTVYLLGQSSLILDMAC